MVNSTDLRVLIDYLKDVFPFGIKAYTTRSFADDVKYRIYSNGGVRVDYCKEHLYIEIFGLTAEQFAYVKKEANLK